MRHIGLATDALWRSGTFAKWINTQIVLCMNIFCSKDHAFDRTFIGMLQAQRRAAASSFQSRISFQQGVISTGHLHLFVSSCMHVCCHLMSLPSAMCNSSCHPGSIIQITAGHRAQTCGWLQLDWRNYHHLVFAILKPCMPWSMHGRRVWQAFPCRYE